MRIEAGSAAEGQRLDRFLADHLGSRAAAQRAIDAGRVRVDGEQRPKRWIVEEGETIEVAERNADAPGPPAEPVDLKPVLVDERFVVVDKPAGLVAHPAPGHPVGTLSQMLDSMYPGRDVGLVHRLDRDTSGLLIAALDEDALRRLREELQARRIVRQYTALVMGRPATAEGTIEAAIGRDTRSRTRISTRTDSPREAVTHFEVAEALDQATLLTVRLETGRTHQIRVHLAEIGLPVAGDPTYGRSGAFGLDRQFLHASRLAFSHPFNGESIELESPLPDDLTLALERARRGERP